MIKKNTDLVPQTKGQLINRFASRFGVDPGQTFNILKQTAFRLPAKKVNGQYQPQAVTNEQMAALLIVADQYGLNPFTREIYAFPDKSGAVVPVLGVDGWVRIINERPELDGIEFVWADNVVTPEHGRPCPEWVEVKIFRKDRARPIVVREYLDEVYRPPFISGDGTVVSGPWQTHTKRMLRHRGLIQAARVAFGFSGIRDEDEVEAMNNTMTIDTEFKRIEDKPNNEKELFQDLLARLSQFDNPPDPTTLEKFCRESAEANGFELREFYMSALSAIDDFHEIFCSYVAQTQQSETPTRQKHKTKPVSVIDPNNDDPGPVPDPNYLGFDEAENEELFPDIWKPSSEMKRQIKRLSLDVDTTIEAFVKSMKARGVDKTVALREKEQEVLSWPDSQAEKFYKSLR